LLSTARILGAERILTFVVVANNLIKFRRLSPVYRLYANPEMPAKEKAVSHTGELAGEVEIIADEVNNAILIKATQRDYAILSGVLKEIDIVPRQVLIDVLIVEVSLGNDIEYGVEWFLKSHMGGSYSSNIALTDPNLGNLPRNTALGTGISGFAYSLYTGDSLRNLIKLLATTTNVNILSAPNILAVDNKESTIEVVQDVPTLTSSTTSTTESGTMSISFSTPERMA